MDDHTHQLFVAITKSYPRFADGRINYKDVPVTFGLNCIVVHDQHILLAERSSKVGVFPNHWSGISGYIDTHESVADVARRELQEEVGIIDDHIKHLIPGDKVTVSGVTAGAACHIIPVFVELHHKPQLSTNWENTQVSWVPLSHVESYKLVPGFTDLLEAALRVKQSQAAAAL